MAPEPLDSEHPLLRPRMPRILIVDDDAAQLSFMRGALKGENLDIDTAPDAAETFRRLGERPPDLILLDLGLPDHHGIDVLRSIRVDPRFDTIPIVLISGTGDLDSVIQGLDLGAVEFISKPVHPAELAARIRAVLRLKLKLDQIYDEYKRLSELSLTDPLTGAYNRRALDTFLQSRLAESSRHKVPVSCVMCDIDHFKLVNDTYGHDTGDLVLREISDLIRSLFRQEDALIRYGGEEFLIILLHTSLEGAVIFSERLRAKVERHVFKPDSVNVRITLSAGIASHPEDPDTEEPDRMIKLADQRLYTAKNLGRNRIVSQG